MGKPHVEERRGPKPRLSKYAAKKAARMQGERDQFQFKEGREPTPAPADEERVRAVLTGFTPGKGHLFLTTEKAESVYVPLETFERDINPDVRAEVQRGWSVVCAIGAAPPGTKYPHATKIFSVAPPPKK